MLEHNNDKAIREVNIQPNECPVHSDPSGNSVGGTDRAAFQDTRTPAKEKNEFLSSDLDLGPSCYQSSEKTRTYFSWLSFFMSQLFVPFVDKMPPTYLSGAYREAHGYKKCKESLLPLPVCHRGTNTSNKPNKSFSTICLLTYWARMLFLSSFSSNPYLRFKQHAALCFQMNTMWKLTTELEAKCMSFSFPSPMS